MKFSFDKNAERKRTKNDKQAGEEIAEMKKKIQLVQQHEKQHKTKKERERERKNHLLPFYQRLVQYDVMHSVTLRIQPSNLFGKLVKHIKKCQRLKIITFLCVFQACVRAHAPLRHSTIDNAHRPHNRSLLFVALALKFNSIPCLCVLRVTIQCVQCTHTITPNATISTR